MYDLPGYRRPPAGTQPNLVHPPYRSTMTRAPALPLVPLPTTLSEITGPLFGHTQVRPKDSDLTVHHAGAPLGERIVVTGRVLDADGRPVPNTLIEVWQANAGGRYRHPVDQREAVPLDPNFTGAGRAATDADGAYRFTTIKPGAYAWRNHHNAWRPAHIHFSLFGPSFLTRIVTQMYFPGDPLLALDPIVMGIPDERGRQSMIARFDLDATVPDVALGYRFDIVLRCRDATPREDGTGWS
ncbi:MAG: protocatechuate 3,4-dioxygenase subunit beta [Rhodospirillales bacterium]|nr:protocatechuate 3,4-dioxygenase subunit beta [Rhodospirillales bacterium]